MNVATDVPDLLVDLLQFLNPEIVDNSCVGYHHVHGKVLEFPDGSKDMAACPSLYVLRDMFPHVVFKVCEDGRDTATSSGTQQVLGITVDIVHV